VRNSVSQSALSRKCRCQITAKTSPPKIF
jgi:hypothetical protein